MKVKLELDRRELTLIRVACLQRLDALRDRQLHGDDADLKRSYDDTKALLNGALWTASVELRKLERQPDYSDVLAAFPGVTVTRAEGQ